MLGPQWVTAANEHGQRRIDDPDDWVRKEIEHAIQSEISILPVMVAGLVKLPPPSALPESLRPLLER